MPAVLAVVLGEVVDADGEGQDEGVVLAGDDGHAVGVADAEPALGDVGHRDAVPGDLVLVVEDVALDLQLAAVLQGDREAGAQGRDQRLPDGGDLVAAALDGHGAAGPQQPLLELEQLLAVGVLDEDGVARPQHLVVDPEDPLAMVVLDPEVVPEAQQLLPEHVAGARRRSLGLLRTSPEHRSPPWVGGHPGTVAPGRASPPWGEFGGRDSITPEVTPSGG